MGSDVEGLLNEFKDLFLAGAADQVIGADHFFCMFGHEGCVKAAEDEGDTGEDAAAEFSCFQYSGVPVGEMGGQEDHMGLREGFEVMDDLLSVRTVAGELAGNMTDDGGFGDLGAGPFPMAGGGRVLRPEGVEAIEKVDKVQMNVEGFQAFCDPQQSQGFHPEVMGGKIMDPGIDQKNSYCAVHRGN